MDPISGFIISLIISIVSAGASMLIKSMMGQDKKQVPGVRGSRQVGGTNPLAFIVGTYGTAGQFEYGGEWGNDGGTPNAFRSEVYSYCDLPAEGLSGRYIAGVRVTLDDVAHPELGYPVLEYRVDGKDHLWFRDYDGTQTTADALLLAKFGADPDRPWASDMVFPGVAYSVVTSLWNRELFAGAIPEPMFEDMGIWFYDVRKDSTAGGAGTHRLDDPSTWAWTDNPIVIIYGILLGIKYEGEWIWGGQDITRNHLPFANWAAQMDKCDALVSIPGGGTEKRFRCGYEISVDLEPQAVIGEVLKTCEGRIAEIGGIYKVLVGEPDAPVVAVTPDDIVVSDQQTFEPFPGLENLFNEMRADYPEPGEAWEMKEAPPRLRSDLVLADDGRRLPFSTSYKAAPFGNQVQRLMYGAIEEARRFARLVKTHPPEFWEYEPLDCYALTDPQDGFVNKTFLITAMDDLPNGNQVVGAQEVDPADYNPPDGFELPWDITPLQIARPAPQVTTGFTAAPYTVVDAASNARRPAIEVFWDSGLVDVRNVLVEVRESWGAKKIIAEVTLDYDPTVLSPSAVISNPSILPKSIYELRGIYVPFSGRVTRWSNQEVDGTEGDWLTVTTPDIKLSGLDVDLDAIAAEVEASVAGLTDWAIYNTRETIEEKRKAIKLNAEGAVGDFNDRQRIRREASSETQQSKATFLEQIVLATGPDSALAQRDEAISATVADNFSELTQSILTATGPTSSLAISLQEMRGEVFDPVTGLAATNDIVDLLSAEITEIDGDITAVNNSILSLNSSVGKVNALGLFRVETVATSAGALATAALVLVATSGALSGNAALYMNAKSDGSSEVFVVANRFAVKSSPTGTGYGVFVVDSGVVWIDTARIRDLDAGNIDVVALTGSSGFFDLFEATWAQIDTAVVNNFVATSANIGTAAIGAAKIGNLEVTTLKLANGAVNTLYKDSRLTPFTAVALPPVDGNPVPIPVSTLILTISSYAAKMAAWVNVSTGTTGVFTLTANLSVTIGGVDILLSTMVATNGSTMVHRLYLSANNIPGPPGNYTFKITLSANCVGSAITLEFAADVPQK